MVEVTATSATQISRMSASNVASPENSGHEGARFALVPPRESTPIGDLVTKVDGIFEAFVRGGERARERVAELNAESESLLKQGVGSGDPKFVEFQNRRLGALLEIQMEGHRTAFGVQIASKLIEHASSGVRTTLQTQA